MNVGGVRYYFGKYRGVVTDTADPDQMGRIKVALKDFPGALTVWCMPCVPYAGDKLGWFVIPEIGARVWIEFEAGNLNLPVWVGCFWDKGAIPDTASPSRKVFKTPTTRIVLDDLDGKAGQLEIDATTRSNETVLLRFDKDGVTITAKSAQITMKMDDGITIAYPNSKIELTAQQIQASEGDASSLTITAQDQTLKSGTVNVQAANQLSVSATSSASVSSGQYTLKASTITLQGAAINIG